MKLRITMVQIDVAWENKPSNLDKVESIIGNLIDKTDLVVLPEMFTTGFSMNSHNLAEETNGTTVQRVKEWANKFGIAICGSFIAKDKGHYYNRGFFISPTAEHYYDKRHLFRMGEESNYFDAGDKRLIVEHKGFKICLLICYDLRFPVWSRNVNNEYDLLIYSANWPIPRINVWDILLKARAIENMAYVCGVNRLGKDGMNLTYNGRSTFVDPKGEPKIVMESGKEQIETIEISKQEIDTLREKFPAWKDADNFEIKI